MCSRPSSQRPAHPTQTAGQLQPSVSQGRELIKDSLRATASLVQSCHSRPIKLRGRDIKETSVSEDGVSIQGGERRCGASRQHARVIGLWGQKRQNISICSHLGPCGSFSRRDRIQWLGNRVVNMVVRSKGRKIVNSGIT